MVHKKLLPLLALITALLVTVPAFPQTQISGNQSGTLGPDTYLVVGDISVPAGQTLLIMPGSVFFHNGNHTWKIYGQLNADGIEGDSISFIRQNPINEHRWGGIRFQTGASASTIDYCVIDQCYHPSTPALYGGGIYTNGVAITITNTRVSNCINYSDGGGIYANNAAIVIDNCVVVDCKALGGDNGGGICLVNSDNAEITHSIIARNQATGT